MTVAPGVALLYSQHQSPAPGSGSASGSAFTGAVSVSNQGATPVSLWVMAAAAQGWMLELIGGTACESGGVRVHLPAGDAVR